MDSLAKVIELRKQIYQIQYDHFMHSTLFSVKWWILIFVTILIIFIWWKLVDKVRLHEIILFGFVITILTFISDSVGTDMVLWSYPIELFGLVKHISELELVIIPISYMFLYQYFAEWKKYIITLIVFSAFGAFAVVPLAVWFGTYKLIRWNDTYSFMIFIFMGLFAKYIVIKIMDISKH